MALKRGLFVVIEGADGTGKSTQVLRLTKMLNDKGHPCVNMRFPDRSTQIGGMINNYLQCKAELSDESVHLLFSANRWELSKQIRSTLQSGTSVVCDRYAFSGVAYTSAKPGFSLSWCVAPDRGLPAPDLVLYLRASELLAQNRTDYGTERYEKTEFQNIVSKRFEEIRRLDGSLKWAEYTVTGGIEEVTKDLYLLLEQDLEQQQDKDLDKLWVNCHPSS